MFYRSSFYNNKENINFRNRMPIEIAGVITGIEFITTKNKRNMRLKPVESIWKKSESKLDTCSYYCLILISGFWFFSLFFDGMTCFWNLRIDLLSKLIYKSKTVSRNRSFSVLKRKESRKSLLCFLILIWVLLLC